METRNLNDIQVIHLNEIFLFISTNFSIFLDAEMAGDKVEREPTVFRVNKPLTFNQPRIIGEYFARVLGWKRYSVKREVQCPQEHCIQFIWGGK